MNNDKLTKIHNLYFNTSLNQSEIAELVGVSQKTISLYISQNNWKLLKKRAQQAPSVFIEQMNAELQEINNAIMSKPEGQRYPTLKEAEVRRKILYSLATVKGRQSAGTHLEVFLNLLNYVTKRSIEDAKIISRYTTEFVAGELQLPQGPKFADYTLPGENGYTPSSPLSSTLTVDETDDDNG